MISFELSPLIFFLTRITLLHAHPQVVYSKCVKFHQYQIIHLGGALTRNMDRQLQEIWTDRRMDRVIPVYPTHALFVGYNIRM